MSEDVPVIGGELIKPESGIVIPDPDQGIRFVSLLLDFTNGMINVWEPRPDDPGRGDDLQAFLQRWDRWVASDVPELHFYDPRFGFDHYMRRAIIPHVIDIGIAIHRKEDTRAMVRLAAVPIPAQGLPVISPKRRLEA